MRDTSFWLSPVCCRCRSTRPLSLSHATNSKSAGHDGCQVGCLAEMATSRSSSPKKRQARPQSQENGSSQSSAGRMEPVFQTLLNPFRHRKDSNEIFSDRKYLHNSPYPLMYLFNLMPATSRTAMMTPKIMTHAATGFNKSNYIKNSNCSITDFAMTSGSPYASQ